MQFLWGPRPNNDTLHDLTRHYIALVLHYIPYNALHNSIAYTTPKKLFTLLDLCVSSLRRGHANLLCIVPILTDDPRRESKMTFGRSKHACLYYVTLLYFTLDLPHQVTFALAHATLNLTRVDKLTWLVLGEDPAARSHRVEQFTAL